MFDIFRKKRIVRYTEGASGYVARTYVPEMSPKEDPSVKHSPEKAEPDIKYSERGGVLYSHRGADDIPAQGDKFRKEAVGELFARYSLNNGSLSKKLEFTLNLTFVDMLIRYINKKGWRDTKVYKAAQIDRRLFSKIMSDREYKPAKDTALALAIALELTLQQTSDLLDRAGYTLSHSNKRDVIIEYFIREGVHNLVDINEVLYKLDQKIIGR